MQTVTKNLEKMAQGIEKLLEDLLLNYSSIYKPDQVDGVFVVGGDHRYRELDETGRRVQSKALEEYRRFYALLGVFLNGQPRNSSRLLFSSNRVLIATIEQHITFCRNTQTALKKAVESLQTQLSLLERLYDSSEGESVYVPDTNALLYSPALETWSFDEAPRFTLVLVPTVLSELDSLKINHRNETVRQKAETLIRQIKEYRRRGNLTEGVPIVKNKIDMVAVAIEPNAKATLPWLDLENSDDRILATVIEAMRSRPRSSVTLVTRDVNIQNKAEFARIPFVEPPEPA